MLDARMAVAVIAAAVAGTLANSAAVAAMTSLSFGALATSPGRLGVAVVVASALPAIYARTSGMSAAIVAIATLTVVPSLLAKFVFGTGASWAVVLGVNAVYAVTAWAVYLGLGTRAARRGP